MFNYTTQSPIPEEEFNNSARPKIFELKTHSKVESIDDCIGHEVEKEEDDSNYYPIQAQHAERNVTNRSALYRNLLAPRETGFRRYVPKRMPASPLPTSPLPINILNPETPRKSRVEREKSKFRGLRINLFNAPVCQIATPTTPIIATDFSFSIEPQEYSAPEASFDTPSTTQIPPTTTDFFFSPNPQVYSDPEAFTHSTTTTAPVTPTTSNDNDEEQVSASKERKEPLRRSARIAAMKVKPNYKE